MRRNFESQGWLPLMDIEHPPPVALIREFYSNLSIHSDDSNTQYVMCCEILKYSQVYEPYRSIVGQERGRTHKDLNVRRKIKSNLNQISPNLV